MGENAMGTGELPTTKQLIYISLVCLFLCFFLLFFFIPLLLLLVLLFLLLLFLLLFFFLFFLLFLLIFLLLFLFLLLLLPLLTLASLYLFILGLWIIKDYWEQRRRSSQAKTKSNATVTSTANTTEPSSATQQPKHVKRMLLRVEIGLASTWFRTTITRLYKIDEDKRAETWKTAEWRLRSIEKNGHQYTHTHTRTP